MKKLLRLFSFVTALVMLLSIYQMPVSALKLTQVDYSLPGTYISIDTESGSPDAQAYLDATVKYSGDYSLKMVSKPSQNSNKEFRVSLNMTKLEKNSDYKITFMMKAQNAKGCQLTITGQSNWWQLTRVMGSNFDWMPVELEFNYPADAATQSAVFIVYAECEGVWIDDVKLLKLDESGVYTEVEGVFSNGGFEQKGTIEVITSSDAENESKESYEDISSNEAVIVEKAENITIDGDKSDWASYTSYPMTSYYVIKEHERSLEANIKYAYDDEAFYYMVDAEDEEHKYVEGSTYWSGDGLQSVFDNNNANGYGMPIGIYFNNDDNTTGIVTDDGGADLENGGDGNAFARASRNGSNTVYEVKVPWSLLGMECPDKIKFNVIINDNDGGVRHGFLRLAPGIGESQKTNAQYPYMFLGKEGSVISAKAAKSEISIGDCFDFNVEYSNVRSTEQEVEISYSGKTEKVTVKPMSKYINTFSLSPTEDVGRYTEEVVINDGENTQAFTVGGSVVPDDAFCEAFSKTVDSWTKELRELNDECVKKGLATDYERADIKLLERYVDQILSEASYGEYARVAHFYDVLPGIYEECRESLKAILSGEKITESVPRYITSDIEIRNESYYATVEKDGIQYESPITFNGINSFMSVPDWYDDMKEYGFNEAEVGIYPLVFLRYVNGKFEAIPEEERYGTRSDEYEWGRVLRQLEACDKNGISVSLAVSTMAFLHMQDYGFSDYVTEGKYHSYHPFNVTHPMVKEQAEACYKEIAKLCEKYECIDNIMLVNEPNQKHIAGNPYYDDDWAEFLSDRYDGDIAELNEVYGNGAKYTDFKDVPMPEAVTYGLPSYHDFHIFCDDIHAQFIKILSDAAKKYVDIPVCAKEMQRSRANNSSYTTTMYTNIEKSGQYMDLAGCDAFYVPSDSGLSLDIKMMWYDYITSVMEAPVQNGEDHIGSDGQGGVENKFYDDFSFLASTWQGMIHGGGGQSIWMYIPDDRSKGFGGTDEFEPASNLIKLPNSMRGCYTNTLDGMRLAEEVNALYTAPTNVGIFWSNTNWSYSAKFMNSIYRAYTGAIENGQNVKFVTESTLDHMDKVQVLIIPGVTHTLPNVLDKLVEFVDGGGRLIFLGEDCLKYDDFNQPADEEKVAYIRNHATVIESDLMAKGGNIDLPENFEELLQKEFTDAGIMDVVLIDTKTGKKVEDVEWIHNEKDGRMLINPFNYNREEEKTVEIWVNGEKAESFTDLKGRKTYDGTITLGTQQPYLIEIGGDTVYEGSDIFNDISSVSWAKEAINGLYEKKIINGVGGKKFAPDLTVSREELVKMLVSACGESVTDKEAVFTDVDSSKWYAPYVASAFESGLTNGVSDTEFGVGSSVTRQDLAVMVYRAAVKKGLIENDENAVNTFSDAASCADYANEAIAALSASGAINGSDGNSFKPNDHCTRAEAAKIIYNVFFK